MNQRTYRIRGLGPETREHLRASLLSRPAIATVRFNLVESDTYEMTVAVSDGTGWVPGVEGLCRSLGGQVLPDPQGS